MGEEFDEILVVLRMRVSVARLGETAQHAWWKTGFLNPTGRGYLNLIFPRTALSAGIIAASSAACRLHDERIGRGRVAHLFRLPQSLERGLHDALRDFAEEEASSLCSEEGALDFLEQTAQGAEKTEYSQGPIRIGLVADLGRRASLSRMAAAYLEAFRSDRPAFPYFTESFTEV